MRRDNHSKRPITTPVMTAAALALSLLAASCSTLFGPGAAAPGAAAPGSLGTDAGGMGGVDGQLSAVQQRLIEGAKMMLGSHAIFVKGRRFNADCVGTVAGIYHYAGIDLTAPFPRYTGNGVTRLHGFCRDAGLLHYDERPAPGDLIFWDNTWDRNGDRQWNDPLTHVGMVVAVDGQGTIEFVHYHYRRGVVTARMNLSRRDDTHGSVGGRTVLVNTPMRMSGSGGSSRGRWLASHLHRAFGRAYLAPGW